MGHNDLMELWMESRRNHQQMGTGMQRLFLIHGS